MVRRALAGLLVSLLLVTALVAPVAAQDEDGVTELPAVVRDLVPRFYRALSVEPGQAFDVAMIDAITADPLRTAVLDDLEITGATLEPDIYYRYRNVRIVGGSCTGDGPRRVCEIAVRRVFETNRAAPPPPEPVDALRVFRARQFDGTWKLYDTQIDGIWLSDLVADESTSPAATGLVEAIPFEPRPLVVPSPPVPGKPGAAPGQVPVGDVPTGWVTHTQADGAYAISLPPDWILMDDGVFTDPDTLEALEELGLESPFMAVARDAFALVLIWRMLPDAPAQDLISEIKSNIDPRDFAAVDFWLEEREVWLPAGPATELSLSVQPRDPAEPYGFVAVLYRLEQAPWTYQLAFGALTTPGDTDGPLNYFRQMAQTFRLS